MLLLGAKPVSAIWTTHRHLPAGLFRISAAAGEEMGVLVAGTGVAVTTTVYTTRGAAVGTLATSAGWVAIMAAVAGDGAAGTLAPAQPDNSTIDASRPTKKLRLWVLEATAFIFPLRKRTRADECFARRSGRAWLMGNFSRTLTSTPPKHC